MKYLIFISLWLLPTNKAEDPYLCISYQNGKEVIQTNMQFTQGYYKMLNYALNNPPEHLIKKE